MSRGNGKGTGKPRQNTSSRFSDQFKGFVTLPLSETAREAIDEILASRTFDFLAFLEDVTGSGYKFSLVRNESVRSHIATLTGREGSQENEGYALSGFGPDAAGAVLSLWAKHSVMCHGGPWTAEGSTDVESLPLFR